MWLKPRVYKLLWSPKSSWLSFLAFQNHSLGKTQVEGRGSSLMGWKSHLDYNMPSGKRRSAFQKSFLKNPLRHSWAKNNNKTRLKNFSGLHGLKIAQNVAFEILQFWHFPPIFCPVILTCLVTLFDLKH